MKKSVLILLPLLLLLSFVSGANKLEVLPIKEVYQPNEEITLKVSLLDDENSPIADVIALTLENADKSKRFEIEANSNKITSVNLGDKAVAGYWTALASYKGLESKALFTIETSELAKFEIEGDALTITNIGNSYYTRDVQILIGDTIGVKKTGLSPGEKVVFRLIAPDGTYNIRVTDGKTSLSRNDVALTGNAIRVLDERLQGGSSITGGARVGNPDETFLGLPKSASFAYIFVLIIIGAGILIAL